VTTNANGSVRLDVPLLTWIEQSSCRVQYFPYWGVGDYKVSFLFAKWLFDSIKHYDLVHTNAIFSLPILPAYWSCQRHKVPYLVTPHGMLDPWALAYKATKKQLYYRLMEKNAIQRSAAIQVLATTEATRLESLNLKPPMVLIPNGIHCHDFQQLPSAEIFYAEYPRTLGKSLILFLGRIDPKKGLDLLASAFTSIHQQFPNSHLVIAGPDNIGFLPTAQGFFQERGCADAVTFTGMLSGSLKYAALAAASVYVAPSYSEGFSMSVLEGMAAGLPCVITTGCNFPEAATAQIAEVVDINAEAIADGLHRCLSYPDQAQRMGNRAREFIFEHYTWNRIAANLKEVYAAILNKTPLPASLLSSEH
jgi:glycosyltransferase involved in cell wall biosynthesis